MGAGEAFLRHTRTRLTRSRVATPRIPCDRGWPVVVRDLGSTNGTYVNDINVADVAAVETVTISVSDARSH